MNETQLLPRAIASSSLSRRLRHRSAGVGLIIFLALGGTALAESAPASSQAAEETIVLPPFEVSEVHPLKRIPVGSFLLLTTASLMLLYYFEKTRQTAALEHLLAARKKGLLTATEFRTKSSELEMIKAVEKLERLRARGVFTRRELRALKQLIRTRSLELIVFGSLEAARSAGIINRAEFDERLGKLATKPHENVSSA